MKQSMVTKEIKTKLSKFFDEITINNTDFNKLLKTDKDVISSLYEQHQDKEIRKKYAQFFTHKNLINFILSHVEVDQNSKILDPACGVGAFLLEAYKIGKNSNNIYGIDIDNNAVELSKINFELTYGLKNKNIVHHNTIKNFDFNNTFPEVFQAGGFDLIIGNPPFQNLYKNKDFLPSEYKSYDVSNGIVNSATLMIIKGYEMLKDGGCLGFVLPKNLIRVESFKLIREFLVENTTLLHIYDIDHYFKDVRGDQILLILKKKKPLPGHKVEISILKKKNIFEKPYKYSLDQTEFSKFNFFPIFYDEKVFSIARKLLNLKSTLSGVCDYNIIRGVGGLSSKHPSISKQAFNNSQKILRGDSIERFGVKYYLYLNKDNLNQVQKNKIKKLNCQKIVLQNICSKEGGIFATISSGGELSLDTVTNIICDSVDLKYLLAILNSKLSNFFILFVIFLNSNFTMHTDREYIGKLPVVINQKEKEKVIKIVDKLLKIENKYSSEFFKNYDELNKIIFAIYDIKDEDQIIINSLLSETMSKKQNGYKNE